MPPQDANPTPSFGGFGLRPEVQLDIANSIWAKKGVQFKEDFLATNLDYYGARTTALDFGDPASSDTINGWASDRTQG